MKLSRQKLVRGSKLELSMTSMIDVIFLLLIFFMVNAGFQKTERNLDSAVQVESRSANPARADLQPAVVDVVAAGGSYAFKLGSRQVPTRAELTDVLRQFPNKGDGAFVRVRDEIPFVWAAEALQACHDAGFVSVSYLAASPGK